MPTNYNDQASWDAAYGITVPQVEPWVSDWEWEQPDGSWGDIATRKGPPYARRAKRIYGYGAAYAANVGGGGQYELWRGRILHYCPMLTTERILFAGTGCGFLVAAFRDAGYTQAYGLEASDYIHGPLAGDVPAGVTLVKENFGGNRLKQALRQGTGDDIFDWVVDEGILDSYDDVEIVADMGAGITIVTAPEQVLNPAKPLSNVVHLVRTGVSMTPSVHLRPDLATWQAYAPSHTWIDIEARV